MAPTKRRKPTSTKQLEPGKTDTCTTNPISDPTGSADLETHNQTSQRRSTRACAKTVSTKEIKESDPVEVPKKTTRKRVKKSTTNQAKTETGKGDNAKTGKNVRNSASKGAKGVGQKKKIKTDGGVEEVKEEVAHDVAAAGLQEAKTCSHSAKFVGAHLGIAGGMHKAVIGAVEIGAKAFALFLRSQRQWQAKPLDDKVAEKFRDACKEHNFSPWHILPHGSYLLNSGSPNPEVLQKTREALADELQRCEKLGLTMYNFHPGSTCGQISVEECLDKIGETINLVHKQTNSVMTVIENMSCQGNTVGGKFEELRGIIDRVNDKSRVGICLDTCHAFAAGFDLATESGYESMMADFERIVGLKYLKAVHLNDSKGKVGSHLDRHENIGKGHIGLKAFKRLMNDPRFDGIPIVLETPAKDDFTYEEEIRLLYSLQDAKK